MKVLTIMLLFVTNAGTLAIVSKLAHSVTALKMERTEIQNNVRKLTNEMDNNSDLERYEGSDFFESLYNWAH